MGNLHFSRKDKTIQLFGFTDVTNSEMHHVFEIGCGEAWVAELLRRNLDTRLDSAVAKMRRKAYEEGWRDAKSKRRRQKDFGAYLEIGRY
jgi:hypothetical protein